MAIFHHKAARFLVFAFVVVTVCMMPGCLEYQTRKTVKYDRKTDSFAILCIYHDFHAQNEKDLEHLTSIWKVRKNLIAGLPAFSLFSDETKIRVSNNEYKEPLGDMIVYRNAWMFGEFLNVAENKTRWVKIETPENEAAIYGGYEIEIADATRQVNAKW